MRARRHAYSFFDDDAPRKEALTGAPFLSDTLGASETLQRKVTRIPTGESVGLSENLASQSIAVHYGGRTRYAWGLFDDEPRLEPVRGPSLGQSNSDTLGLSE